MNQSYSILSRQSATMGGGSVYGGDDEEIDVSEA